MYIVLEFIVGAVLVYLALEQRDRGRRWLSIPVWLLGVALIAQAAWLLMF